jgi:dienelactone hydrolase
MKRLLSLLVLGLMSSAALAAIVGQEVEYKAGATTLKGYIAWDDAIKGKRPGVLVVHEWWGHNEYARRRARMLAELGYTALAVDMYGNGKQASHPDDAGKFAGEVRNNMPVAEARFQAARKLLQGHESVDARHISAIGYCFGGGVVLEMMRRGVKLDGVASFHGSLVGTATIKPGSVKTKVLIANGADDPFTTAEQIAAFKKEMETAKVDYRFINYPGAKHAFTNPDADKNGQAFNMPLAYNAEADALSWQELDLFLKELYQKK